MSARANRLIFAALLALIGVSMLLLNCHTPLMMDDYDYSFSWATGERLTGIGEIVNSQIAHYRLWGGRSVVHFLAQLFLLLGKPVFNAANAAMYVLLLLEICVLAKHREQALDWRMPLIAHTLLLLTVPFFGTVFLWLDGACNYLWGTALALLPLLIAKSERGGGFFDTNGKRGLLAVPICFIAGWTNENTACGVLAAILLLLVWDKLKGRRIRGWRIAAFAAQALGTAVMLLAPGNFARAAEESGRSLVMELIYRAAVVTYCLLRYAAVPLALAAITLLIARRKRVSVRLVWLCVLGAAALLSSYALVGSPQISDRSFTGVIALAISALLAVIGDLKARPDERSVRVGAVLALAAAFVSVGALGDAKAHEGAWLELVKRIETAAAAGEEEVMVSSVRSNSRFTMDIALESDPDAWPNSTLSKYFGVRVRGL